MRLFWQLVTVAFLLAAIAVIVDVLSMVIATVQSVTGVNIGGREWRLALMATVAFMLSIIIAPWIRLRKR